MPQRTASQLNARTPRGLPTTNPPNTGERQSKSRPAAVAADSTFPCVLTPNGAVPDGDRVPASGQHGVWQEVGAGLNGLGVDQVTARGEDLRRRLPDGRREGAFIEGFDRRRDIDREKGGERKN